MQIFKKPKKLKIKLKKYKMWPENTKKSCKIITLLI